MNGYETKLAKLKALGFEEFNCEYEDSNTCICALLQKGTKHCIFVKYKGEYYSLTVDVGVELDTNFIRINYHYIMDVGTQIMVYAHGKNGTPHLNSPYYKVFPEYRFIEFGGYNKFVNGLMIHSNNTIYSPEAKFYVFDAIKFKNYEIVSSYVDRYWYTKVSRMKIVNNKKLVYFDNSINDKVELDLFEVNTDKDACFLRLEKIDNE
jgi:hypothetical protein